MEWKKIEELEGFTMRSVVRDEDLCGQSLADAPWRWLHKGDNLTFGRQDGRKFAFHHLQGCCESVVIEDVLDAERARAIRAAFAEGKRVGELAREYGVNTGTVTCVLQGRTWR